MLSRKAFRSLLAAGGLAAAALFGCANYLGNAVALSCSTAYVSSVSYGLSPVGNDASGGCGASTPLLTLARAQTVTVAGGTIYLNGNPAAPPTYAASGSFTKAHTIRAVVDQGAILAGTDTTRALTIAPTGGESLVFGYLIVDPSLNSGGAAARCADLTSQATTYSVTFIRVTCRNFTTYGVYAPASAFKGNVAFTSSDFTASAAISAIHIATLSAGGVTVSGGNCTITNHATANVGACTHLLSSLAGVTASVEWASASSTLDTSLSGAASHHLIYIQDIASAHIGGSGTYAITGTPALRQCYVVGFNQASGSLSTGGSTISGTAGSLMNVANNCVGGGIAVFTAMDSIGFDRTKAQGSVIEYVAATGIGTAHGLFLGSGQDQIVRNSTVSNMALCVAAKLSDRPQIHHVTGSDCKSSYVQWKASNGVVQHDNVWTAHATYNGNMFDAVQDPTTLEYSDGTITGDQFIVSGATGIRLASITAGSSATFVGVTWNKNSGSISATPWSYQGTNITTFGGVAGWAATHGPTDTSNIP